MEYFRRLFVGISLPQSYGKIVVRLQQTLQPFVHSKVRWVPSQQVHVTLCFLGQIKAVGVEGLVEELAGIRSKSYQLCAGGGGFFPKKPPLRVIWAGFTRGSLETIALAGKIGDRMIRCGHIKALSPIIPHLTLGRIRKPVQDPWETILQTIENQKWPQVSVDAFTLWESVPGPQGSMHNLLETFPLADS